MCIQYEFLVAIIIIYFAYFPSQGQFQLAMQLVGREFTERVMEYKDVWLPARAIVQEAIESRLQVTYPKCVHNVLIYNHTKC